MIKYVFLFSILSISVAALSQTKADIRNISDLCGCFEVQFQYSETLAPDEEYEYHNRERISKVVELVIPIEESRKKMVLQHLLVINDTMIIKHWREDWIYENPVLFNYVGDKVWEKQELARSQINNRWTQTVWEVSDAPRYQGVSEWVSTDNKNFWMNTTYAPLPRREYSKRKDYNLMKRRNMIVVDQDGWVHEQDNQKIIREGNSDSLLVEEKGINSYKRIDDSKCAAGKIYWEKNKAYWARVRDAWDTHLKAHSIIKLNNSVEGKPLYHYLNDIGAEVAANTIGMDEADVKVKAILDKFVSHTK